MLVTEITAQSIDEALRKQLDAAQHERRVARGWHRHPDRRRHRARRRPEGCHGRRASRSSSGEGGKTVYGLAQNLEEDEVGAVLLGDVTAIKENDQVRTTGRIVEVPVGQGYARPRRATRWACPSTARAPSRPRALRPVEFKAPGVISAQAGARAHADRHPGHRLDDPHRPRPARAHHRRPPDRQDGHRGRRHHQPKGQAT